MSLSKKLILKVALKFLENLKILKNLSLKNAIFKHFCGFFAYFYAILAFRDNRVSPATGFPSAIFCGREFFTPSASRLATSSRAAAEYSHRFRYQVLF